MSDFIPTPNTSSQTAACMPIRFSFFLLFFGYQLDLCCLSFTTYDSPHSPGCSRAAQGLQLGQGKSCVSWLRSGPSLSSQKAETEFPLVSSLASPNNSDPPSCEIGLSNKTIILHIITRINSNHSYFSNS